MRRLSILLAAAAMVAPTVLPALADSPPLPDFPTGDLWTRQNNVHIQYDVSGDEPEIVEWWGASWIIPYGYGVAFDSDGYMYLPVAHDEYGLYVYDEDPATWAVGDSQYFDPIGYAPLDSSEGIRDVVIVEDRLIASSNSRAAIYVFDIADPFVPEFLHAVDLSSIWEYGSVGDVAVDEVGDVWLAPYRALLRVRIDSNGAIREHDLYRWFPDNTGDVAFEQGTDRLFYSAVNFDYISIRDTSNPWDETARITGVCGDIRHNPGTLAFSTGGDLYIACSGYTPDGSDVVKLPRSALQSIVGTVEASTLEQTRFSGPSNGGGFLAFRPAEDPASLIIGLVDDVTALNLGNGISNSLDAKLANAVKALNDVNENNNVAAINKLKAFINEVEAQSGNHIPVEDATSLILQAQQIIDLLTT